MTLHSEILEQPDRLADLYARQRQAVEEIARAIHQRDIRYVFLAARGTSDNAGRYANYLWGAMNGLPLALDGRLKEVGFGEWEGKSAAEIEQGAPGALARFKVDPVNARPAGAEPLADYCVRVAAALEDLLAQHAGQHMLLVGHAGVMRMALAWVLHIPLEHAYRIEVATASLTRLRFDDGRASLIFHGSARVDR